MNWLIDTNVLSELHKARPNSAVSKFIEAQPVESLFVTDITLAEITYGIGLLAQSERRAAIQSWLDEDLRPFFKGRILGADEEVWLRWKELHAIARQKRDAFPQPDMVIASIALTRHMTVVTRDDRPFLKAGALVLNPWTAKSSEAR